MSELKSNAAEILAFLGIDITSLREAINSVKIHGGDPNIIAIPQIYFDGIPLQFMNTDCVRVFKLPAPTNPVDETESSGI